MVLCTSHYFCHGLKSIDISYIEDLSDVGISALAAGCSLLQEFIARSTNITDAGVIALARGCVDLRKIDMRCCQSIGFDAISAIAENCPPLSEVVLYDCKFVDRACRSFTSQHCHNLLP